MDSQVIPVLLVHRPFFEFQGPKVPQILWNVRLCNNRNTFNFNGNLYNTICFFLKKWQHLSHDFSNSKEINKWMVCFSCPPVNGLGKVVSSWQMCVVCCRSCTGRFTDWGRCFLEASWFASLLPWDPRMVAVGRPGNSKTCPECSVEHWPQYSMDLQLGRSLLAEFSTPRRIGISEEPHSWVPELFYLFIFNDHVRCCGF